jgi:hypothetical protein
MRGIKDGNNSVPPDLDASVNEDGGDGGTKASVL